MMYQLYKVAFVLIMLFISQTSIKAMGDTPIDIQRVELQSNISLQWKIPNLTKDCNYTLEFRHHRKEKASVIATYRSANMEFNEYEEKYSYYHPLQDSHGFNVRDVTMEDAGWYSCETVVSTQHNGSSDCTAMPVGKKSVVYIFGKPGTPNISQSGETLGKTALLKCELGITSRPEQYHLGYIVTWFINGRDLVELTSKTRYVVRDDVLVIPALTEADLTVNFSCAARENGTLQTSSSDVYHIWMPDAVVTSMTIVATVGVLMVAGTVTILAVA